MTSLGYQINEIAALLMVIVIAIAVYIVENRERFNREARSGIKTRVLQFIFAILFFGVIRIGFIGFTNINDYNPMWFPFLLVLFILAWGKEIKEEETSLDDPLEYITILLAIVGISTLFFFTLYLGWFPDWVIGLIFLSAILWERG